MTIIFGVAGFMSIFVFLINKRIESIEKRFDDVNKRIDDLRKDMDYRFEKLEQDMREIRELLYKVLGTETKKG